MTITPFMTYLTLHDVEYEDQMIEAGENEIPNSIVEMAGLLGISRKELQRPSGIKAGVVISSGSEVSHLIKPGFKVYYHGSHAFRIKDLWMVDARAVVAFEDLDAE